MQTLIPNEIYRNEKSLKRFKKLVILFLIFITFQAIFITSIVFITVKSNNKTVKLPNVEGKSIYDGFELLQQYGFNLSIETQYFPEYELDTIIVQEPKAGTIIKTGRTIYIIINAKKNENIMPNLIGMLYEDALYIMSNDIISQNDTLKILKPIYEYDKTKDINVVLYQNPEAGRGLTTNLSVQFTLNRPDTTGDIFVSNFVETPYLAALSYLEANGFSVTVRSEQSSDTKLIGKVISQSLRSGNYNPKNMKESVILNVGVGENESLNLKRFTYIVPNDKDNESILKVILEDESTSKVIYNKPISPGLRVPLSYELVGKGSITIYYNDIPYEVMEVQ